MGKLRARLWTCKRCHALFSVRSGPAEHCSLECRFWSRVAKTPGPCWLWTGSKNYRGYGLLSASTLFGSGHYHPTNRISWVLHHGPVPDGMFVLHRCDTPACVNPDHLFLGTHRTNMADMRAKGRGLLGQQHHRHKLTDEQAREILCSASPRKALAEHFGVCLATISHIKNRRQWRHIQE